VKDKGVDYKNRFNGHETANWTDKEAFATERLLEE